VVELPFICTAGLQVAAVTFQVPTIPSGFFLQPAIANTARVLNKISFFIVIILLDKVRD
jgi:hypothetical protein